MKALVFFIFSFFVIIFFTLTVVSHAALVDNGDGTITDTDTNLMWLQNANYSGLLAWSEAKSWADNFSFAGYNDWRLPIDLNDCVGTNCTESEMAHLYYSEAITASSPTPFFSLRGSWDLYWTGSSYYSPGGPFASYPIVKTFDFGQGFDSEQHNVPYSYNYAMAVRVVPEPISSTLFIVGGATLGFRRFRKKIKSN